MNYIIINKCQICNSNLKNFRISSFEQKINLLKKYNVDFIITKNFTKEFSKTKSVDFINQIIGKKLIANKNKNFLSFRFNLNLIFFTNKKIKNKKGTSIPICFKTKIIGNLI